MKKNNWFLKSLSLVLVLVMLLVSVGCGGNEDGENSNLSSDVSQSTDGQTTLPQNNEQGDDTTTGTGVDGSTTEPSTTETDEEGNVITTEPSATETDASGNIITTTSTNKDSGSGNSGSDNSGSGNSGSGNSGSGNSGSGNSGSGNSGSGNSGSGNSGSGNSGSGNSGSGNSGSGNSGSGNSGSGNSGSGNSGSGNSGSGNSGSGNSGSGNSGSGNSGSGNSGSGTTTVSYNKPAGNYNYIKDSHRYQVQYDCLADYDKDNATLKVTQSGGPANFVGLFMDAAQTYVFRANVTPSSDGMLARIIFKGTHLTDHMYLALADGNVSIYDCANVYKGDALVPVEIWRCDSPIEKDFTFKGGKTYDVVIMTSPTAINVWIDGKQYVTNATQSSFKDEGAVGSRADASTNINDYKMSRYLVDECYMGAYYVGKAGDVLTLSNIDIYYPTAGMDKNYIDDGSDTNYQSTFKQDKFYMGTSISFNAMYENGKKYTEIANLLKGANINLVIPYLDGEFANNPTGLYDAFQKAGLNFIASTDSIYGRNAMDAAQIEKDVKALSSKYSNLVGYYIWDEPRTEKFWKVRRIGQVVTKADPSAALLTALLPSYGTYTWTTTDTSLKYTNHISTFISKVKPNILTMDYYPFQQHGLTANMKTNGFWKDLGYLTFQANKNDIPYWMWVSGIQEWTFGKSDQMTLEHMKEQIYGSVAYGCKGVLIFNANECIFTNDAKKSSKYDGMAQLNKAAQNIGNLLFNAERSGVYHTAGYSKPATAYLDDVKKSKIISSVPTHTGSDPGFVISTFTEGSKTYLVVFNKNYSAAATGTIKLKKAYNIAAFDAANNKMGTASSASEISINLGKAEIQVYELT